MYASQITVPDGSVEASGRRHSLLAWQVIYDIVHLQTSNFGQSQTTTVWRPFHSLGCSRFRIPRIDLPSQQFTASECGANGARMLPFFRCQAQQVKEEAEQPQQGRAGYS